MPPTNRTVTMLVWSAVTVSTLMTVTAFWLSYSHLHTVAGDHGVTSDTRAWAWPAIVDMFIVVGEITLVIAFLGGLKPHAGWALTIGGTITSVIINVWGVGTVADALTYVVAGLPPVASLISFGVIMRYLHAYLTRHRDTTPTVTVTAAPVTPPPAPALPPTPAVTATVTRSRAVAQLPTAQPELLTTSQAATYLGVGRTAIAQAVKRNSLTPDVIDDRGHHHFTPATLDAYRKGRP